MKKIIITGADEKYSKMLIKLINSLHQFNDSICDAIGVLDLGLSIKTLEKIKNKVNYIIQPKWDFKVNESIIKNYPHLRALTSRPFLNKYFPGYDLYLWIDSDAWVQNRFAVDWLFNGANKIGMSIIPTIHHSYYTSKKVITTRLESLNIYYPNIGPDLYWHNIYYNAGVFALKNNAIHWNSWAKKFEQGLKNTDGIHISDQSALNYAIWSEKLPIYPLPATCNWCCHLAHPSINTKTGKFFEPHIPHKEIGIIHMTSNSKNLI